MGVRKQRTETNDLPWGGEPGPEESSMAKRTRDVEDEVGGATQGRRGGGGGDGGCQDEGERLLL